jgi:hypothetical protein
MHHPMLDKLEGSAVLITLATVQFLSMQTLTSAYLSRILTQEARSAQEMTMLRAKPIAHAIERLLPRQCEIRLGGCGAQPQSRAQVCLASQVVPAR